MKKTYYCLILLLFVACNNNTLYYSKYQLAHQVWSETAIQRFTFHISDINQVYDIILLIRNNLTYPYQNLFISYELHNQQTQLLQSGLIDCKLFEAKTGNPLGKGWFNIKKHQFILLPGYQFPESGNYHLALTQFMRTEELIGIEAIGIRVNKNMAPAQITNN